MNEDKFTGLAGIYAKYRPAYPNELIDYLYKTVGFETAETIADIGCGTGIFSKMLLERGSSVICVDPNEDMLGEAKKKLEGFSKCTIVRAAAESTTLPDSSVDFITVAQAFHWFDRRRFADECRRILKPGGKAVLIYNSRDSSSDAVKDIDNVYKEFCPQFIEGTSGHRGLAPEKYADFFRGGLCDFREFENPLEYDEDSFIGRSLTTSYSLKHGDELFDDYIAELKNVFKKHSVRNILLMPNMARSYAGSV